MSALAVVVSGKEGLRLDALARAVAGFRGVTIQDGAMIVRRARGILAEDLDEAEADDLARRLSEEGIPVRILPATALVSPPPPLLLARAEPTPDALQAEMHGETLFVPWGRIRLVAVAPFTATVYRTVMEEAPPTPGQIAGEMGISIMASLAGVHGVHIPLGGRKTVEKRIPKAEFHLLLDLLLEGPTERLRVDAGNFNFSGLGKRMAFSPHLNLKLLLESIVAAAPTAATSPGADLLLTGGRLASLGYASVDDFEREMRWLAAVAA